MFYTYDFRVSDDDAHMRYAICFNNTFYFVNVFSPAIGGRGQ